MTMTEEDLANIQWNITRPWEDRWKTVKTDASELTDPHRLAYSLGPVDHTRIDHQNL
jgi:hypothetical protein